MIEIEFNCRRCENRQSVPLTKSVLRELSQEDRSFFIRNYEVGELIARGCRARCPNCNAPANPELDPNIAALYGSKGGV